MTTGLARSAWSGWNVARLRFPFLDQTTMPENRVAIEALRAETRAGFGRTVVRLTGPLVAVVDGARGGSSRWRGAIGREQCCANPRPSTT